MSDPLSNILKRITLVAGIEVAFCSYLLHREEHEEYEINQFNQELSNYFENVNQADLMDNSIKRILQQTEKSSHNHMPKLLNGLEYCMKRGTVPARRTCEVILNLNYLDYKNARFWIGCFKLMKNVLKLVDYKGVRDILKMLYEKARELPLKLTWSTKPQDQAFMEVVTMILDRNACLLPGYLVVSELIKPHSRFPHWTVAGMFSNYIESFRACTQMVTIVGLSHMRPVVKYSGCSDYLITQWKLDPTNLCYSIKRGLPYDPEVLERQESLLRYVLIHPYGRDMACGMLGLNKNNKERCAVVEEQLVELLLLALERSEVDGEETDRMWAQLSSQLIYFVLFSYVVFSNVVTSLCHKLQGKDVRRGRDHLMWMLLQFISGSIQRHSLSNFMPVIKLYDLLFPEQDLPLPVPDFTQPQCTRQMAMLSIWLHLMKKCEQAKVTWPLPTRLRSHHEFLQHLLPTNSNTFQSNVHNDFRVALLCNAYSTNSSSESFSVPMAALVETLKVNKPGTTASQSNPISLMLLDSLTIHAKMSLIHCIVTQILKLATTKSGPSLPLSPALLETYSRLLVYTEIESLGMKGFIGQLLPQVYKGHAWGVMYNLLEMFNYRMYHIQPHYRVQILGHLHSLGNGTQVHQPHLYLCLETAAIKLTVGLSSHDVQPEITRMVDFKAIISNESEELNRVLVLTLARASLATRTDATWCLDILTAINQQTPHQWSKHTLARFPKPMQEFFNKQAPQSDRGQLRKAVEEESRKWSSMTNENDMMAHFGVPGSSPLFLCLIWRTLLESNHISPIAYKILERIGAKGLSAHLRKFCECLVYEFSNSQGGQHVNKCVDTINDMLWKYNILTIDRLVLCLTLKNHENNDAQVAAFIIQLVVLKSSEFRSRVTDFVKDNSPDYWRQTNWHEKHMEFHRKYPEKFSVEEQTSGFHSYFGNVCLRFLSVFDVVVHRFIEITQVQKSLEVLLDHLGCLYRYHHRPISYLYDTLLYYDEALRENVCLKKKLCNSILSHHKTDLSPFFQQYLANETDSPSVGVPDLEYYISMMRRMVGVFTNMTSSFSRDWRFSEFPNAVNHILYVTCVELMSLPVNPQDVTNGLLDVTIKGHVIIPLTDIHEWINVIGLTISTLPQAHWNALLDRLLYTVADLETWSYEDNLFRMFNFKETHLGYLNTRYSYMIAMAHSVFHHSSPGQINSVVPWIKSLKPSISTECQFLFVCHLIGPFLQRVNAVMQELSTHLYELLVGVNGKQTAELKYMDTICDFFYHIKYMYGDYVNSEVEALIKKLSTPFQMRLRFMGNINLDEPSTSS